LRFQHGSDRSDLQEQRLAVAFTDDRKPALRLTSSACYSDLANEYYCGLRSELLMLLLAIERNWRIAA
jgi:hypothetical protein